VINNNELDKVELLPLTVNNVKQHSLLHQPYRHKPITRPPTRRVNPTKKVVDLPQDFPLQGYKSKKPMTTSKDVKGKNRSRTHKQRHKDSKMSKIDRLMPIMDPMDDSVEIISVTSEWMRAEDPFERDHAHIRL
jgi:hypothetical protein